ncbi:hypothetical protein ERO13_D09G106200v2 [Gossypium hirsutum]|uniref:Tyrosine-specific transport protein isoform X2 n=1 Tax=Gossypium hirsutum TaxID=3635 RepID=A0A1U8I0I2_GOSHI|nr:tyrosine-specific transport protein isoform X2 [Gossypium hirsutum]KAG4129858.1 hypothetical protein ERO13_D09G106200v2 [Gossypium hirsutum]
MSISMTIRLQTPTSLISLARPRLLLHTHNLLCPKSLLRNRLHHHSHHQLPTPFKTFKCSSQRQSSDNQPQEYEFERLFSNLNQATLKREPGSLSSATFLVAGTTVGAGILAIPAVTQDSGFLASTVACILCWVFMVATGLLIAEVNVNTMCELGSGGVSLVSMARRTLGPVGVQIACWSYIFIHYALLVAYLARSSDILTNYLGLPLWESATLFSLVFGGICYFGSQRFIGAVNGVLVFGIIASFIALVAVASGGLEWDALLKANFEAVPMSIPIIALSFVYQNVVPVLCTNLEGNMSKVRTAIVVGTAIPLGLFLVWDAVILGSISSLGMGSDQMVDPLQQLRASNSGVVGPIIEVFSLLAIATSYIGFVLGLSDFLADLLKLPAGENRPQPYLLTLIPPIGLALLDPEIFFKALDFAGTYGAMSWSDRYSTPSTSVKLPELVPGGRLTLTLVMLCSGGVIVTEILESLGHP